jgi:hypothetical protein
MGDSLGIEASFRVDCPPEPPVLIASVADIPDSELLRRAITNARDTGRLCQPVLRWVAVMHVFQLGSIHAAQLCRRFGLDPDEMVTR